MAWYVAIRMTDPHRPAELFVVSLAVLDDGGSVVWANEAWQRRARERGLPKVGDDASSGFERDVRTGVAHVVRRERSFFAGSHRMHGRTYALHARLRDRGTALYHVEVNEVDGALRGGGWEWDLATDAVHLSPPLLEVLACPPDAAPHTLGDALRFVADSDRGRIERAIAAARASGILEANVTIIDAHGALHFLRIRGEVAEWKDGVPLRMIGVSQDISGGRHADDGNSSLARLNEAIANLGRSALATFHIPDLLQEACVSAATALGDCAVRVLELNAGTTTMHLRATCGVSHRDDLSHHDEYVLRATTESVESMRDAGASAVWRSGIAVAVRSTPYLLVLNALSKRPDRFGEAEEYFLRSVANVLSAAIARRRYEAELVDARLELKALVDNTPDIIIRFDRELRIDFINPTVVRMTGLQPAFFLGRRFAELPGANPDTSSAWEEALEHVRSSRSEFEFEERGVLSGREYNVRCVPQLDLRGQVDSILAVCRDMTEKIRADDDRRRLELQLEQATRLSSLGRLAATVAHEFNNVLMAIQPFADLLNRRAARLQDSAVEKAALHITQAVKRGRRITQEMLRYTRPVEPVRAPVDVRDLLEYVCNAMKFVVGDRMNIQLETPKQDLFINADRSQVEQVFTNLIANARDAIEVQGQLTITADRPKPGTTFPFGVIPRVEDFVHFTFRDDGAGIPPQLMQRIFEPLFTSKRSGTGVGLAVAQQVISLHGGHVFVESQQGVGTTFHLFLPVAHGAGDDGGEELASLRSSVGARRIAIVEDEDSIAEGLMDVLMSEGFATERVASGADALRLVERFDPDVLLLDVGLPDVDGLEVYARLRRQWPDLPVIFSTGHADRRKVEEIAAERNVGFLMKPYEIEDLFAMLAKLESA